MALNSPTLVTLSLASACIVAVVLVLAWPVQQPTGADNGSNGSGILGHNAKTAKGIGMPDGAHAATRAHQPSFTPAALAALPESIPESPRTPVRSGKSTESAQYADDAVIPLDLAPAMDPCPPVQTPDFRGRDLAGSEVQEADFKCADLRDATLAGAELIRGDLRGADLTGADLQGADLRHADLRHVTALGADMAEARLTSADLREADLRDVTFRCPDCPAERVHASFWWVNLQGADLRGADFGRSDLGLANLQQADLRGANLSQVLRLGTPPDHALLRAAIYDASTKLPPNFDPASRGMLFDSRSEGEER